MANRIMDSIKILNPLFLLLLTILFTNLSCTQNKIETTNFINSKLLAVFVEAKNKRDGLSSGSFGDVVLMDLKSKERIMITDDRFYDLNPHFSPNGEYILFQSNRIGEQLYLDIKGIGGPFDIFIYDIEKQKLSQLDIPYQTERPKEYRETIREIGWMPDGKNVFFKILNNEIYLYNIESKTTSLLKKIIEFPRIENLSVSVNNVFVFSFRQTLDNLDNSGLAIYNIATDSVIVFENYSNTFGPWNKIGDELLYWGDNRIVYLYNYPKNEKTNLFRMKDKMDIYKNIFQNKDDIILLAGFYRNEDILIFEPKQVVIYNFRTKQYNWVTNTPLEKDWMDVYIRD